MGAETKQESWKTGEREEWVTGTGDMRSRWLKTETGNVEQYKRVPDLRAGELGRKCWLLRQKTIQASPGAAGALGSDWTSL